MLKSVRKYKEKVLKFLNEKKIAMTSAMVTCSIIAHNTFTVHASEITGNLSNASNGAQQEALGWVEAVGGLGIVIGAFIWFSGNSKMAKTVIMSVGIGYVLIKFSPQLWKWYISIF